LAADYCAAADRRRIWRADSQFVYAGRLDRDGIRGVIISSVVPPVNWTLAEMSRIYFGQKALFVEAGVKTGMSVLVDNPLEVGAGPHREWRWQRFTSLAGRAL